MISECFARLTWVALPALVCAASAGCTTESKARLLPFAQSRFEIAVGDAFEITVALTRPATEVSYVDIDSVSNICRAEPSELRFNSGERVTSARIIGVAGSRGVYRRVTFTLRGTDTSNSLLVSVQRRVPETDGAADAGPDGTVDAPSRDGVSGDADGAAGDADGAAGDGGSAFDTTEDALLDGGGDLAG